MIFFTLLHLSHISYVLLTGPALLSSAQSECVNKERGRRSTDPDWYGWRGRGLRREKTTFLEVRPAFFLPNNFFLKF